MANNLKGFNFTNNEEKRRFKNKRFCLFVFVFEIGKDVF